MASFESFVEKTNRVATVDGLFAALQDALNDEGYDKVLFAILSHHREIGLKPGIGIIQNYPTDWMNYYFEKGLDGLDPIPRYAAQRTEAFSWQEVERRFSLTPAQKRCLAMGTEAGLHHGVGVPLFGEQGEIAGISVASSEKQRSCELKLDLLTAYCNQFYLVFRRLHRCVDPAPQNFYLTTRERDVLSWGAHGKCDDDIGDLLNMSRHTVNRHLRSIYAKLGVKGRIKAVVKAIELGLIHPEKYSIE